MIVLGAILLILGLVQRTPSGMEAFQRLAVPPLIGERVTRRHKLLDFVARFRHWRASAG